MKRKYSGKPKYQQDIAKGRISKLFEEAKGVFSKDAKLSNRYVHLARKIAMKYKVRIPSKFKRRFCKHCYSYLVQGKNSRVRLQKSKVVISCLNCKKFMRFVIKK